MNNKNNNTAPRARMPGGRKPLDPVLVTSYAVLALCALLVILPFWYLIMGSLTDETELIVSGYSFWPKQFSLAAYQYLVTNAAYLGHAYGITIFVTVVGTAISLVITTMLGYTLARTTLPGRKVLNFLVVFTMLFNGGLVPTYLIYTQNFGIKNTIWALIVPSLLMSAFNVMLARNFFENSIPYAIIEAATIDGASEFTTFRRVVLPLSLPIIATIGLFVGVTYWNDWKNGMYYINKNNLYGIQNVLNQMLTNLQFLKSNADAAAAAIELPSGGVRMAIACVAVIPILVAYPFFQKYFVKGISIGAVKE